MSDASQAKMIQAPNSLRLKVGGSRFGGIDAAAVAKAEAALKSLSDQFGQWLNDELVKLDAAQAAVRAQGWTEATAEGLYLRAHDLKGLGATYEYPLVTRIAGSMCRMLDDASIRMRAPLVLLDAHVDAIKAAVRDQIKDDSNPLGRAIAETLETKVADHLASLGR